MTICEVPSGDPDNFLLCPLDSECFGGRYLGGWRYYGPGSYCIEMRNPKVGGIVMPDTATRADLEALSQRFYTVHINPHGNLLAGT